MKAETVTRGKGSDGLLLLLQEAQQRYGCIPAQFMSQTAESLGLPLNDIYAVASFYSFLSVKPLGRNIIKVCKSLPCYIKNNSAIVEALKRELGIKPGQTTPDARFSLQLVNCMGLCDGAPAIMVNDDAYTGLTGDKIVTILEGYK